MSSELPSSRFGFLGGVVAGAAAGLVLLLARLVTGVPSLLEVVAEALLALVPLSVFDAIITTLTFAARPLLLTGVVVGYLLLSGGVGALFERLVASVPVAGPRRYAVSAVLALATLAVVSALVLLLGRSPFGSGDGDPLAVLLPLLLAALVFATVLVRSTDVSDVPATGAASPVSLSSRRAFLRALAGGSVLVVTIAGAGRAASLVAARQAQRAQAAEEPLPPEITPNDVFYTVSKNFGGDPVVSAEGWTLEIGGFVERPYSLTYDELRALPAVEDVVTLECVSNEIGGDLIGNARWKGVRLVDLLARAGLKPGAIKVVLIGADNYEDSITAERALSPANLLAYEMNGETLPNSHGFPARLLVPGIYGMKNVKWLRRITVADYDYKGYWQRLGWSDDATIKTMSRLDRPRAGAYAVGDLRAGGIAFAGDRGISGVEISFDDGKTWQAAQVRPALSAHAWSLWTATWPAEPGQARILVRATDGNGVVQESRETPPLPDGKTGLHGVTVQIEG